MLRTEYEVRESEDGYSDEGRVGDDEDDVDDEADYHEKSCERFQFVVRSKQVLNHFEECFIGSMIFSTELIGRSC